MRAHLLNHSAIPRGARVDSRTLRPTARNRNHQKVGEQENQCFDFWWSRTSLCRNWGNVKLIEEVLHDWITVAGSVHQFLPVRDLHRASAVLDKSASLHGARDQGHRRATRSYHHCKKLLGEIENIGLRPILRHQQPASQPLLRFVETMATRDLS
jgi:hypothetical protein